MSLPYQRKLIDCEASGDVVRASGRVAESKEDLIRAEYVDSDNVIRIRYQGLVVFTRGG